MKEFDSSLPYYHKIDLPDGRTTPGRVDRRNEHDYLGFRASDALKGKRILDIGALDGVLSFISEQKGAEFVKAIDVEKVEKYDWGFEGPPEKLRREGEIKNRVFYHLKSLLDSRVERECKTVYDLDGEIDGEFDVVYFYGVLYHLRHPLLAFDKIRSVCKGAVCVETHICNVEPKLPSTLFYFDDVLKGAVTNWTGPTEACVVHWMKDAGFERVFYEKKPRMRSRQRFVGLVEGPSVRSSGFPSLENFAECDEKYFLHSRKLIEDALERGSFA